MAYLSRQSGGCRELPAEDRSFARGRAVFFNRHMLLVAMLGGAVAVPYLSKSDQAQKLVGSLDRQCRRTGRRTSRR